MTDITELVKPIFKQTGMSIWTDMKAGKDENGDMRVMARSLKESDRDTGEFRSESGPWAVWKYLPESDLSVLNYPRYGLSQEKAEALFTEGY